MIGKKWIIFCPGLFFAILSMVFKRERDDQTDYMSLLFFSTSKRRVPCVGSGLSVCKLLCLQNDQVLSRQLFTEICYLSRSLSDMLSFHFCKYLLIVMSNILWSLCKLLLWGRCWTASPWACWFLPPHKGLSSACSTVGRSQTGVALFLGLALTYRIMW